MRKFLGRILLGSCSIALIALAVRFLYAYINFFGPLCAAIVVLAVAYLVGSILCGDNWFDQ